MKNFLMSATIAATSIWSSHAMAATEIQFWHAFTGRLGELVAEQIETFNSSQSTTRSWVRTRAIIPRRSMPALPRFARVNSRTS